MKKLICAALLISCTSAFAITEVECRGTYQNKEVEIEIQEPFPRSSYYKDATLTVDGETFDYRVSTQNTIGYQYLAPGFHLTVEIWPDSNPRWGRTYYATLRSRVLGNFYVQNIQCRYPFGVLAR